MLRPSQQLAGGLVLLCLPGHHLLLHINDDRTHLRTHSLAGLAGDGGGACPERILHSCTGRRYFHPVHLRLHNQQRHNSEQAEGGAQVHSLLLLLRPYFGPTDHTFSNCPGLRHKLGQNTHHVQISEDVRDGLNNVEKSINKGESSFVIRNIKTIYNSVCSVLTVGHIFLSDGQHHGQQLDLPEQQRP